MYGVWASILSAFSNTNAVDVPTGTSVPVQLYTSKPCGISASNGRMSVHQPAAVMDKVTLAFSAFTRDKSERSLVVNKSSLPVLPKFVSVFGVLQFVYTVSRQ